MNSQEATSEVMEESKMSEVSDRSRDVRRLESTTIRYCSSPPSLSILDQRSLPLVEKWTSCDNIDECEALIKSLAIRGAPLIGICASLCIGVFAIRLESCNDENESGLNAAISLLKEARPTAVNLVNNLNTMLNAVELGKRGHSLAMVAESIFKEDVSLGEKIAMHGVPIVPHKANILTYCNTGSLATAGGGTALGVIIEAHKSGKGIHVWVCETRPLLQGARLTAWELMKNHVPHTLLCDNMAADLMRRRRVDLVIVGADRIAVNGDFANKVGTYSLAVASHFHHVLFYVAAPSTTVDPQAASGECIPVEHRAPSEVRGVSIPADVALTTSEGSGMHHVRWAPDNCDVYNPAFDVTPSCLVTGGWILDEGLFTREKIEQGALKRLGNLI